MNLLTASHHQGLSLPIAFGNATELDFTEWFAQNLGQIILHSPLPTIGELMKSLGSHGSSSLLFMMKVMV
jgi:hypothetical protein